MNRNTKMVLGPNSNHADEQRQGKIRSTKQKKSLLRMIPVPSYQFGLKTKKERSFYLV
jgi:hypothetical protein